ncbi:heavy-metal-associated domain-containing protein [Candidatus Woesearchaeota archaeon]|jgi:copper chaperone CopZ|nr:heavy-metal-associated domain-containing protein [Candidatus Woesearchaeota archaeon]
MKIMLNVEGMHCKSCETLIKDELDELEGIKNVNVSAEKGIATIEYDESKVDKMKIIEIIKKEGYKVKR